MTSGFCSWNHWFQWVGYRESLAARNPLGFPWWFPMKYGGFKFQSSIIELDDGKILTGKPNQFDGKNPWVSG
jgi:hypothetical protein